MPISKDFNPFSILPRSLMLRVLLHTYEQDATGDFKHFMDYDHVSDELRDILGKKENLKFTLDSMPTEFNIQLIETLKHRKIETAPGRYRASVALLFLQYMYSHVKPFADDEFLEKQYPYYFQALEHIKTYFDQYPMVMYITAYLSFYIAKRMLFANQHDATMRERGANLYKLAIDCVVIATQLEHPLASLLHNDMNLQMARHRVSIKELIQSSLPKVPKVGIDELVSVLTDGHQFKVDLSHFSDEDKDMLVVTWQKLLLENCTRARELFKFVVDYDKLMLLTDYFYQCFVVNHFHRHVLAHNPIFVLKNNENLLYLLKTYKVKSLVNLHQGFRVFYPKPDSVLLTTVMSIPLNELKEMAPAIDHFLTLPQRGYRGWRMCFIDGYRHAVDDGTLKKPTAAQMRMVLNYYMLVDRAGEIDTIMEREAHLVGKIFRINDDKLHNIASAVIHQLRRFTTFDPLGHLDHQEILLSTLYQDREALTVCEPKCHQDYDQMASAIILSYKRLIADSLSTQHKIIVPDFIQVHQEKLDDVREDIHQRFVDLGYMKAA